MLDVGMSLTSPAVCGQVIDAANAAISAVLVGKTAAWFDFSDSSKMFLDEAGTTQAIVNQQVLCVKDKLGAGYSISVAAGIYAPFWRKTGTRRWLDWDGNMARLAGTLPLVSFGGNLSKTVFVGATLRSTASARLSFLYGTTGAICGIDLCNAGNVLFAQWGNDLTGTGAGAVGAQVVCGIKNGNTVTLRKDGVVIAGPTALSAANITSNSLKVGYSTETNSSFAGGMTDIILVAEAMSVANVQTIEAALQTKAIASGTGIIRPYAPSGVTVASVFGQLSGDCSIYDGGSGKIMYFFRTSGSAPTLTTKYKTAVNLAGLAAASEVAIPSLDGYGKFMLLADETGAPVVLGGLYHGYASSNGIGRTIHHFTCATQTGTWAHTGEVIPLGGVGSKDEYVVDCPSPVYKSGLISIYYMAEPAGAIAPTGLGYRVLEATASDPAGPFTKNPTEVLAPSTTVGDWNYGLYGGTQRLLGDDGVYYMVVNAIDTRPSAPGDELPTSRIGFFTGAAWRGPWVPDPFNPYIDPSNVADPTIEFTNSWRGFLARDDALSPYRLFFNTGAVTETLTYATPL